MHLSNKADIKEMSASVPTESVPTESVPTESDHFQARYKTWIGSLCLVLGIVAAVFSLRIILIDGRFNSSVIFGLLATTVGFLLLTRPYFAIAPNRLTVYGLLGKVVKRYPFAAFSDIKIENGRVSIENSSAAGGSRESVKLTQWLVNSDDWKTLKVIASPRP